MGALLLPVIILLLVSPTAAGQRVWRLGGWGESPVPQVMVPELAAFGPDHDRRT